MSIYQDLGQFELFQVTISDTDTSRPYMWINAMIENVGKVEIELLQSNGITWVVEHIWELGSERQNELTTSVLSKITDVTYEHPATLFITYLLNQKALRKYFAILEQQMVIVLPYSSNAPYHNVIGYEFVADEFDFKERIKSLMSEATGLTDTHTNDIADALVCWYSIGD